MAAWVRIFFQHLIMQEKFLKIPTAQNSMKLKVKINRDLESYFSIR
jgi:hypothetical protein